MNSIQPLLLATFLVLNVIASVFQLALVFGAPWGEYTMGGKFPGKLPNAMRLAAAASLFVILLLSLIAVARTRFSPSFLTPIGRIGIWFVAGFFLLGSIANLATPSVKERRIWAPVNIVQFVLSLAIAWS